MRRFPALVAVLLAGCTAVAPIATDPPRARTSLPSARTLLPPPAREPAPVRDDGPRVARARVTHIRDGDTFEVSIGGRIEPVRFIGIDTPEVGTPYADDATAFTHARAPVGSTVWLERDVEERDRYGRLLAYVWLTRPSSRATAEVREHMLNARLLLAGRAVLLTYPPNVRYVDRFTVFQATARRLDRGLWGAPAPAPATGCDPSYPDVCIPPPPPDLDCADVRHRNFRVTGADPHGFDAERDGRGCEG